MDISTYIDEIDSYPLLTKKQEIEYTIKLQNGDREARDILVNSNLRLVIVLAKKYSNLGIPLTDLIQEGNIGLITAADKFDINLENRFSTYACFWIRQRILKYISTHRSLIRLPMHITDILYKIRSFTQNFKKIHGHAPTNSDISKGLNIPLEDVLHYSELSSTSLTSFEQIIGDNLDYHSLISSKEDFEKNIIKQSTSDELLKIINTLTPRERDVIINRFGLCNCKPLTLEEIGCNLNLTRERIRQIQGIAINKLKKKINPSLIY